MLYQAITDSPSTALSAGIDATMTTLTVVNLGAVPEPPCLLTLGVDQETTETVLVTAIDGESLTVQRGIDGAAQAWPIGTKCARVFTAYDWNSAINEFAKWEEQLYAIYPIDEVTGSPASFPDGADGMPVKSLMIDIEPVQSGSGDPAPDNVRPFTTFTGVTVKQGADEQEASAETIYSVSWETEAGAIYGGTMDVTNGTLSVEWAGVLRNGADSETYSVSSLQRFSFRVSPPPLYVRASADNIRCDRLRSIAASSAGANNNFTAYVADGNYIGLRLSADYTTVDQVKAWLSENPTTFVYRLATPLTYQLTLTEISTLLGANFIWSSAGSVDVTYRADIQRYIQKLTAPTEDDMTANTNISSGQYFIIGNTLYRSTAAIAQGASIIPGTNCALTNLAEALNTLNA